MVFRKGIDCDVVLRAWTSVAEIKEGIAEPVTLSETFVAAKENKNIEWQRSLENINYLTILSSSMLHDCQGCIELQSCWEGNDQFRNMSPLSIVAQC